MSKSFITHCLFASLLILFYGVNALAQNYEAIHLLCSSPPEIPTRLPTSPAWTSTPRNTTAYQLPFDTIRYNHTLGSKAFDLVFCIDGITNVSQAAKADRYVDSVVQSLQHLVHYGNRFNYFNIFRIAKFSTEEGASWGFAGDTSVNNRYGTRFNAFGLPRLIVPDKFDTLKADVQEYVPQADLVLTLVFDKKYGGAGWRSDDHTFKTAIFTIDEETGWHAGDEVALHEMQHLMDFDGHGYPGDEYEDSLACPIYVSIPPSPNVTDDTVNHRKWQHCMNLPGVGFFPHAGICPGNYKPTNTCLMQQTLGLPPLCPVCRENSTAWFDSMINPIYAKAPLPATFAGDYTFYTQIEVPLVNTFRFQWLLDDSLVAADTDSLTLHLDALSRTADHLLQFVCTDTDAHIIDTTLRRPWRVSWLLPTRDTLVAVPNLQHSNFFSIAPNPVADVLYVLRQEQTPLPVQLSILDGKGEILYQTEENSRRKTIPLVVKGLPPAVYLLRLAGNWGTQTIKFVKQ